MIRSKSSHQTFPTEREPDFTKIERGLLTKIGISHIQKYLAKLASSRKLFHI